MEWCFLEGHCRNLFPFPRRRIGSRGLHEYRYRWSVQGTYARRLHSGICRLNKDHLALLAYHTPSYRWIWCSITLVRSSVRCSPLDSYPSRTSRSLCFGSRASALGSLSRYSTSLKLLFPVVAMLSLLGAAWQAATGPTDGEIRNRQISA